MIPRTRLLGTILIACQMIAGFSSASDATVEPPEVIFKNCKERRFDNLPPTYIDMHDGTRVPIPTIARGPMVPLGDGEEVHSSVLKHQAELIARAGLNGFDEAFRHLDADDLYVRWIAVESLFLITEKRPVWYLFARPDQTWNGDPDWSDRAKAIWRKWKAEQAGDGDA